VRAKAGVNRREFLVAAAAVPALSAISAAPAFAEPERHEPPYLALKPFIEPGKDEFPEEKAAIEITQALQAALQSGELPLAKNATGFSPFQQSQRAVAVDVRQAVFAGSDSDIALGWRKWIADLGTVRRAHFDPLPGGIVRYEVASIRDNLLLHRVGQWKQTWSQGKLTHFEPVEEYVTSASEPLLRDVTAALFAKTPSFPEQLSRGVPYWRARLDPATGIDLYGSNGLSVGDIDNDGLDEIYVCQPGGLPNRLYKYSSGALTDITETWGVGLLDETSSALFLDLRNIGRQDLIVLRSGGPILFLNEGGRYRLREDAFRFRTSPAGAFTGMAAADFDRDSKLDLYLCCYVYFQSEAQYTYAVPYDDARNGPPNFLFRNNLSADGSGFFEDCTAETGINENNDRFSFAPAWCDFNDDGWPDLFVANDFGRKNLYVNKSGHFRDIAASAGVEDIGPGMSAAWFDYDADGKPDLYVANMWTAAGQRVAASQNFAPAREAEAARAYRGHTMGNSLYRNRGDGRFENVTAKENVGFGRWAWASGGHDLDNDGNPEILVTCGMLTNESSHDLDSFFWREVVAKSPASAQPSAAYENGWNALNQFIREEYSWSGREPNVLHMRRGNRYFDFSGVSGFDFPEDSRSFAVCDFDNDGRPDIILKSRLGPQLRVLQNNCAGERKSIAFRLQGTKSNRDAVGARIEVDGQVKWLDAGSGFLSQHSKRILFGLGTKDLATLVRVKWPSGEVQEFRNLPAGNTYVLTEGSSELARQSFENCVRLPSRPVQADNRLLLHDTWFAEPIPLPDPQRGPALLVILDGESKPSYLNAQASYVDLARDPSRRRLYETFRRYLFDWRTELKTPVSLLLNSSGEAVKVYGKLPSENQLRADLAQVDSRNFSNALPFPGRYVSEPHRDFFKFGAAFLWAGYTEQALPYLQRVLERNPSNVRVLVLVGQIHLQSNQTDDAQRAFQQALVINNSYAEAWAGLGDVCATHDRPADALANYQKALSLKPDLLYTLLNAGQAADKLNRPGEAEAYYRQALQLDGKSAEALNGLGLALAKQGKAEDARAEFEQAIALRRDYADAINNLGVLYIQQGKTNDAIAAFQYGIQTAPTEDILYLNLGRIYIQLGKPENARQVMQQLLDKKPDSATARRALQELNGR
jgi:tetratricopeptide (TPR) repeat protein